MDWRENNSLSFEQRMIKKSFFENKIFRKECVKATPLILILLLTNGCATAKLSKGPDPAVLINHDEIAPIGVATAMDERDSEKIGTIGATSIVVKKNDLVDLVGNHLVRYINEKIGLNVERVQVTGNDSIKLVATKKKVEGVIVLRIKSLKMFSMDALLQPVEVNLTLELVVFDESGQEIYRRIADGHYEKRIGITVVEKSAGELVEAVVKETLSQYVKDSELKKIIAKFKYGTLGGAIAQIF